MKKTFILLLFLFLFLISCKDSIFNPSGGDGLPGWEIPQGYNYAVYVGDFGGIRSTNEDNNLLYESQPIDPFEWELLEYPDSLWNDFTIDTSQIGGD